MQDVYSVFSPTVIENAGDGSGRLFYGTQQGLVYIWEKDEAGQWQSLPEVFLNLTDLVFVGAGYVVFYSCFFPCNYMFRKRYFYNNIMHFHDSFTIILALQIFAVFYVNTDSMREDFCLYLSILTSLKTAFSIYTTQYRKPR